MRATLRLLTRKAPPRLPVHVTLFTRASCGLCRDARKALAEAWDRRPFEYVEIDVMAAADAKWRDAYEFDVPVVHVVPTGGEEGIGEGMAGRKLMHRFGTEEVVRVLDEVAGARGAAV